MRAAGNCSAWEGSSEQLAGHGKNRLLLLGHAHNSQPQRVQLESQLEIGLN